MDYCCGLGGGWFCDVGMRVGTFLGRFSPMSVAGNSIWNRDFMWIFGFFGVVGGGTGVGAVEVA